MPDYSSVCVVQFAKLPVTGNVKTRMMPHLSPHQARDLHLCLLKSTARALSEGSWHYELWLSQQGAEVKDFALSDIGIRDIGYQCEGDLGWRMYDCFRKLLKRYEKVILVGSDCPYLNRRTIEDAVLLLERNSCVLTPADDGGYVLVGLKRVAADLFEGISWGTDQVLNSTEQVLKRLEWEYSLMESLSDIDEIDDLRRLVDADIGRQVLEPYYSEFSRL